MDLFKPRFDFRKGRLIPRKEYKPPFRFVGLGIIAMVIILFIFYKIFMG
jgi:hypothetical protein